MPFATLRELNEQVAQIKHIIDQNEQLRIQIDAGAISVPPDLDHKYWRQYDYCAAVLRLYSSFERFIIDVTQRWLDWVVLNRFEILANSQSVIARYRHGSAEILRRSTEPRFAKVNLVTLVDALSALQREKQHPLSTDPFFSTTPNLRFDEVAAVLECVEIGDLKSWIKVFLPFADVAQTMNVTVESFLKDLVERRNEAAHGNRMPDDFWAPTVIKEFADLLVQVGAAVAELTAARMTRVALASSVSAVGTVVEVFKGPQALIVRAKPIGLWVGMKVLVLTHARCYMDCIGSIQLNGVTTTAWLASDNQEVGLKLGTLPTKGAQLLVIAGMSS